MSSKDKKDDKKKDDSKAKKDESKKDLKKDDKKDEKKKDDKKDDKKEDPAKVNKYVARDQLKKERDEFKKENFPFMKIAQYGAPGFKEDFFRVRRASEEDWRDVYGVLFLEYFLVYNNDGSKTMKPLPIAEPIDFVRLDGFNYKLVDKIETRMVSGGLIPRKEKYENTFITGFDELEMLIECKDDASLQDWMPAIRQRVKHCLLAKKEFGENNPEEKLNEIMELIPREQELVNGPQAGAEDKFITQVAESFKNREYYASYLKHVSFFFATYTLKNKPYIDWFTAPGSAATPSFERDLWESEDKYVTGPKGWKGLFSDFTKMDREMKRVQAMKNTERYRLVQECDDNINRLTWYNKYIADVHQKPVEFDDLKKKWETAKTTLETWIQKEKDDIKAEEERLKAERKKELQRQKDMEKESARQQEIALANPLSDVNVFITVDDPFADVHVDDVLNEYGEFV